MSTEAFSTVSRALRASRGDGSLSWEGLLPLVHDEPRALARARIGRLPPGQTLQATALVHEAYLRVLPGLGDCHERAHFFAALGQAMRDILVEQLRRKQRIKRGGDRARIDGLDLERLGTDRPDEDLLGIDRALTRLEAVHPDEALLVKLRFFSGLSMAEVSQMLSIPPRTLGRRWRFARAWLRRELKADAEEPARLPGETSARNPARRDMQGP